MIKVFAYQLIAAIFFTFGCETLHSPPFIELDAANDSITVTEFDTAHLQLRLLSIKADEIERYTWEFAAESRVTIAPSIRKKFCSIGTHEIQAYGIKTNGKVTNKVKFIVNVGITGTALMVKELNPQVRGSIWLVDLGTKNEKLLPWQLNIPHL
jgi:hypothetical protein